MAFRLLYPLFMNQDLNRGHIVIRIILDKLIDDIEIDGDIIELQSMAPLVHFPDRLLDRVIRTLVVAAEIPPSRKLLAFRILHTL